MPEAPFLTLPPGGIEPYDTWWLRTSDGVRLRAALWRAEAPGGLAIVLPGRSEYLEKQAPVAAGFVGRGFDTVSVDLRGQGLSDRLSAGPLKGHVDDFADFQHDVDALFRDSRVATNAGPVVLYGHSMGGTVALDCLRRAEMPVPPEAVVLTAPMLAIAMGAAARLVAWAAVEAGAAIGLSERWPPGSDVDKPYVLGGFEGNVLTHDRLFWDWLAETATNHPELTVAMPTIGWLAAARRAMSRLRRAGPPDCPVLCLLGSEESVVDPATIRQTVRRMGARLHVVEGARHEILCEAAPMRADAWRAIDGFLGELGIGRCPA